MIRKKRSIIPQYAGEPGHRRAKHDNRAKPELRMDINGNIIAGSNRYTFDWKTGEICINTTCVSSQGANAKEQMQI